MGRWRNRWADRAYVPRPKLRELSAARRADVLGQLHLGIEDSPVLSALGWTVHARRGRFYFEEAGEVVGRITPTGRNMLLLEVEGRSSWHEEAKTPSASAVVEHMASDAEGTFHGLGPLDAVLREHGSERLEMCPTGDSPNDWWYLDLVPADGTATVVEVLYHVFRVPIPVIAEPRGWWERHRTPSIVEHRPDAVFVDFEQVSAYGNRFGGRCLYARRARCVRGAREPRGQPVLERNDRGVGVHSYLLGGAAAPGGLVTTPPRPSHYGFVRRLMSHRDVAEAQLRWLLPASVVDELDWTTLRQGPTDTADVLGRARRSDVIFDVRTAAGEPLLVHVLVEHQRSADPLMAFRMVQYQTRIWQAFVDQSDQTVTELPPILPIVLYNGLSPWRAAVAIEELARAPATWSLRPHQLSGRFVLFDLSQVADEQIELRSANPHLQLGLLALKHTDDGQAWERFLRRTATVLEVLRMVEGRERVDELLHYMFRAARPPSDEERRRVIQLLPNVEMAMTSWAQQIEEQARAEERVLTLRETLKVLLTARFGALPATAETKLEEADEGQLNGWVRRFTGFEGSLDEFLAT